MLSAIEQASSRPDADLSALEMALITNRDERLRRLALSALIAQARQADGWSDERLQRLRAYGEDPAALVAEAAHFVITQ